MRAQNTITTKDGTEIYFKDWGEGRAAAALLPRGPSGSSRARRTGCTTHKDIINAELLAFLRR